MDDVIVKRVIWAICVHRLSRRLHDRSVVRSSGKVHYAIRSIAYEVRLRLKNASRPKRVQRCNRFVRNAMGCSRLTYNYAEQWTNYCLPMKNKNNVFRMRTITKIIVNNDSSSQSNNNNKSNNNNISSNSTMLWSPLELCLHEQLIRHAAFQQHECKLPKLPHLDRMYTPCTVNHDQ